MEVLRLVLHLAATEDGNEADKSCGHVNSDIQENPPCLTMLLPAPTPHAKHAMWAITVLDKVFSSLDGNA